MNTTSTLLPRVAAASVIIPLSAARYTGLVYLGISTSGQPSMVKVWLPICLFSQSGARSVGPLPL